MKCIRCQGLMVHDRFSDLLDSVDFEGWRCIPCGAIIDQVIIQNKQLRPELPRRKSSPHYKVKDYAGIRR